MAALCPPGCISSLTAPRRSPLPGHLPEAILSSVRLYCSTLKARVTSFALSMVTASSSSSAFAMTLLGRPPHDLGDCGVIPTCVARCGVMMTTSQDALGFSRGPKQTLTFETSDQLRFPEILRGPVGRGVNIWPVSPSSQECLHCSIFVEEIRKSKRMFPSLLFCTSCF